MAPATMTMMDSLPDEKAGDGSAANLFGRQAGGAVGLALIGAIVKTIYSAQMERAANGEPAAPPLAETFHSASRNGPERSRGRTRLARP